MSQEGIIDIIGTHPDIPILFVADVGSAVPIANTLELLGEVVAAGTHPFRSIGSGNTITYQVQFARAVASTLATAVGLAAFDSTDFSVDANGFVTLNGSGAGQTITGNSGGALTPTGGNWNILGSTAIAGSTPVTTVGSVSTLTVKVQISQGIAATDVAKIGLCNFDSAKFSVDVNGFVTTNGSTIPNTITGNTGGALSPTSGNWNIVGNSSVSGTNPVQTTGSGSTLTVNVQKSQALAAADATKVGLCNFDSARFSCDVNGFVTLNGSGAGETITGQSGGALSPTSGNWNISGSSTAAGTSPVVTSGSGSTLTVNVQKSQAIASTDATKVGLANFSSAQFSVDANGFVTLLGGGQAIDSIAVQTGTSPIAPTAAGLVTINGAVVAAGVNPIRTNGTGANTLAVEVQISQAIASTDATKIGLCNFDSSKFAVDANGFVTLSGTGVAQTITGTSGGALSPTAGNWNILGASVAAGTTPVATSGSGSTLTVNVQKAQAIASTDATKVGLSTFNSNQFAVDANGFAALTGNNSSLPAFLAELAASRTNATGDGTDYTIVWGTEIFDQNNNFDNTSTFTAPRTGIYQFNLGVLISGLSALYTGMYMSIATSNRTFLDNQQNPGLIRDQDTQLSDTMSVLVDMDTADTCAAHIWVNGSAKTLSIVVGSSTDPRSFFSGFLVC